MLKQTLGFFSSVCNNQQIGNLQTESKFNSNREGGGKEG